MLVASAAVALLLVVVLGFQIFLISAQTGGEVETAAQVGEARDHLSDLAAEQVRLESVLSRPENEAAIDRSLFLNTLLMRKGISWTLIFRDLEEVMPYNVKLVSIQPRLNVSATGETDNEIQLDMTVAAESMQPVVEFLKVLEGSPLFGATSVAASQPPTESEPLYRYQVSVSYVRQL
jgi:type IV pilus assembly protein PilN